MMMVIRFMVILVPPNLEVYIFGSFIYKFNPNDLDLLIVYDSEFIRPIEISNKCEKFIVDLEKYFDLKVDVTYLTIEENMNSGFSNKVKAISYGKCSKFRSEYSE